MEELLDDLRHMDSEELIAFGRKAQPGSVEHREAQTEFKRRRDREIILRVEPPLPAYSSGELAEMAANAPEGTYPWVKR